MKKPTEQSLTKLADAAFRQAALTVIKCAEESGTPIIVWKNGSVVKLEPRKTRSPAKSRSRRTGPKSRK
jgi:hypothetical protein